MLKNCHAGFFLQLHNKYLRAKKATMEKYNAAKFYDVVLQRLEAIVDEEEDNRTFSWRQVFLHTEKRTIKRGETNSHNNDL